jgi:hypothetical protein
MKLPPLEDWMLAAASVACMIGAAVCAFFLPGI